MNTVLLLVDLQNDYLSVAGLEPGSGFVVERAAQLLKTCRELRIPVIHIQTSVSRGDDRRMPHWKKTDRWSCEADTSGHAPPDSLQPIEGEAVIGKTFFSAFSNSALDQQLRAHHAQQVILCGVHLHACVRQTALDAYERGYEVCIADDAVASDDPVHASITRRYLATRAAKFLNVASLIAELRGNSTREIPADVSRAVLAAASGIKSWSNMAIHTKSEMLERLALKLKLEAKSLAALMAQETGKPICFGEMEVLRTAEMLHAVIRSCECLDDEILQSGVTLRRRPHGVVAIVTPWNNPVYIALGKIAPALQCGNAVVWKPSPHAEKLSRRLLQIIHACGFPPEVLQLVLGDRSAAAALMCDENIAAVSLTGSSLAGYAAQEICARRRIPLQAELGGNNAAIVWEDCDLRDATHKIAGGAFEMAGQRCTANRRVIVHEKIYDEFVSMLERRVAAIPCGDPLQPDTRVGPLVSAEHAARVAAIIERSIKDGLRVIRVQSEHFTPISVGQREAWHPPVIVCCDDPANEIVQEETFGPVLVVQKATDWQQAMNLCNGVRQGLAASLFTISPEKQERFLVEARAGILKINRATADAEVGVPFGGWKASGIGPPEHGSFDRDFYLRPQTIYPAG